MLSPRTKLSARDFSKLIVLILHSSFSSARIIVKATTVPLPVWGETLIRPILEERVFLPKSVKITFRRFFPNNLNVISGQNSIFSERSDLIRFNRAWRNLRTQQKVL